LINGNREYESSDDDSYEYKYYKRNQKIEEVIDEPEERIYNL